MVINNFSRAHLPLHTQRVLHADHGDAHLRSRERPQLHQVHCQVHGRPLEVQDDHLALFGHTEAGPLHCPHDYHRVPDQGPVQGRGEECQAEERGPVPEAQQHAPPKSWRTRPAAAAAEPGPSARRLGQTPQQRRRQWGLHGGQVKQEEEHGQDHQASDSHPRVVPTYRIPTGKVYYIHSSTLYISEKDFHG